MGDLYFVENAGCHDETIGLVRVSEEDFTKFKTFIENLNKNSMGNCMPVISVYKVNEDQIHLVEDEKDETRRYGHLYLDDGVFILNGDIIYQTDLVQVI